MLNLPMFFQEEETEADVLGLLEFRECEMRQLELSLGESALRHLSA